MLAFFSQWELIVILAIALLLFGTRLPGVARSAGRGIGELRKGIRDVEEDSGVADVQRDIENVRDTVDPRRIASRWKREIRGGGAPPPDEDPPRPAR